MDAHVEARESIVARVNALGDLATGRRPLVLVVCQGVDIGSQAGRGRGIYTGDMMIHANVTARIALVLLEKVDEIWRTKLAQGDEGLGTGFN